MRVLHFQGKGIGWMTGVTEYVTITEEDDVPAEDFCCPGFVLKSETEVDLPHTLPLETSLVPRG